jgi:hypothetical protein
MLLITHQIVSNCKLKMFKKYSFNINNLIEKEGFKIYAIKYTITIISLSDGIIIIIICVPNDFNIGNHILPKEIYLFTLYNGDNINL